MPRRAKAAAETAVPVEPSLRVETDSDGGATYEAHVTKSDGTEVVVKLDKDFGVMSVERSAAEATMVAATADPAWVRPR